jgi:predicted nucleotidyltransferase
MRTKAPHLLPLIRSTLLAQVLATLLHDADRTWTADELTSSLDAAPASVHRELHRALDAGLLVRDDSARPHRFRAAQDSPLFPELRTLMERTYGVEITLAEALSGVAGIDSAVLHGSWVEGPLRPRSDIDVLAIGNADFDAVLRATRQVGERFGRRIDLVVLSPHELEEALDSENGFVRKVLDGPRLDLVGDFEAAAG